MEIYRNKRVFVSGGAGVIGTYLVRQLSRLGAEVLVGDLQPKPADLPAGVRYREGDLNTISPDELLTFEPEYYFHLAATFERSDETPEFWEENARHNLFLSHYLINILKQSKHLKKVIFASSYLIYDPKQYLFETPQAQSVRLNEQSLTSTRNLCGAAKLYHEKELAFLTQFPEYQFEAVSARIFRSFGENSRDIISRWVRALLNREALTVYAKEGRFDYIYAKDVAEGLLRLGASNTVGVVNLGSGQSHSVAEVLEVLCERFPEMACTEHVSDISYEASQANMDYFKQCVNWVPQYSLKQAIGEIIAFEQARQPAKV